MAQSYTPTTIFPLPPNPDNTYTKLWGSNDTTQPSDTAAFNMGINGRDNGTCVVCGDSDTDILGHCHIIPKCESTTWEFMRDLGYIPSHAKTVAHESRNGILMCGSHHKAFDHYRFYIRWNSATNEFIVVNHSQMSSYENMHGNVLNFNTNTRRCPFPTVFLWHESRVRGFHPTHGDRPITLRRGGLRGGGFSGGHRVAEHDDGNGGCDTGRDPGNSSTCAGKQVEGHNADAHAPDDTFTPMRLEGDNLAAWLEAARQHSSWKDCMVENLSWDGTAEENIAKYKREVGAIM